MMWQTEVPDQARPIGYRYLVETYHIHTLPHHCWSYISSKWEKKQVRFDDQDLTLYIYPPSYAIEDNLFEHLEFALKHEGVNLLILKLALLHLSPEQITTYIQSKPTGKYARILWYLYEQFSSTKLAIDDVKLGGYVALLDEKLYYCGQEVRSMRHRVVNNLLGNVEFSPMVRKTAALRTYEQKMLQQIAQEMIQKYDPAVISRGMRYLYTKETMSSWEIEREKPDQARLLKFVTLLQKADLIGGLSERTLVNLQKEVVDPRFACSHYRDFQNYVGEEPQLGQLIVHFIAPKPEDVPFLMQELIRCFHAMEIAKVSPVVAAAVLSFMFVYIHPFEDGNGRLHRYLIHYSLARLKFSPEGFVFPVSAVMLRDFRRYDKILESFSRPLMELIDHYQVNDIGQMQVQQYTLDYYRYVDLTLAAEYLFECVDRTITTDFQEELNFLTDYDRIKRLCREIIDMPDQKIDLFIKCVRQNDGKLSARKRETYFPLLTDEEIAKLEKAITHP